MQFDVITLFPEVIESYCSVGIIGRAFNNKLVELNLIDLREFGIGKYKKVDDEIYGGGTGMLLKPEPVFSAYESIQKFSNSRTVLLTPSGNPLKQTFIRDELLKLDQLIIFCGRYEGFDERIMTLVDYQLSVGNYVLSGGEIGAMILIDSISRLVDGVLPKGEESHGKDSFSDPEGIILEAPQYTRPAEFNGMKVPDVLISGNHSEIAKWRKENSKQIYEEK
ncbi:MAG: tRNA (guanosine(37)-N1)-methyltransferase TrmD [Candidatus Caenarcaniphilales bacterium]|nr:tRNA (guanosine(37)-N1)-methyltransferase TrmD [Candidatus Caenarcaniphilales bacterium]